MLVLFASALPAVAELQNVEVGGEVRARGRYWRNVWADGNGWANYVAARFWPSRPLGDVVFPPRGGLWSRFDWDDRGADLKYVEQRTTLGVKADFTEDVNAVITLESYDVWGEDFRSNYITGADARAATADDLEFIEAYIEADNLFGQPLRLRIGRQLITLGKGWLVGETSIETLAQPFDAVRLTFDAEDYEVDAFWSKLAERSPVEEDGDADFYGVYGTYKGFKPLQASVYFLWLRDAQSIEDQVYGPFGEWVEEVFNVDKYRPTNIYTYGVRLFGRWGGLDYDLEVARQRGYSGTAGHLTREWGALYSDSRPNPDFIGADVEVGYTFDVAWQPRVYVGGALFEGADNRGNDVWQTFSRYPGILYQPHANLGFNRLFSSQTLAGMFDDGQVFTNLWQGRLGVDAAPTEKLSTSVQVAYLSVFDPFEHPRVYLFEKSRLPFLQKRPLFPVLTFWDRDGDDELGWLTTLKLTYAYSDDLYIAFGWEHLFTGDGMAEGHYVDLMNFANTMGSDDDDADYFYVDTGIQF